MKYLNSIYDSNLTATEISVYLFLKDHSNKQGESFFGVKSIASAINKSPRTVQRCIVELQRCNYITIKRRYRKNGSQTSNLYKLVGW